MLKRYSEVIQRRSADAQVIELQEKLFCPLHTLELYLEATKSSQCIYLFVNPNNLCVHLNANHAASLIVDFIKSEDPGAHFSMKDIRSFSSSLAWLRGATCINFMSSCHGTSGKSFINTYFLIVRFM